MFIFGKSPSSLCSFCKQADQTILHLSYECNIMKEWWKRLYLFLNDCFHLPQFLPQTAFFGFFNTYSNNLILENHALLLFKIYLYNSKVKLRKLIRIITKVKDIERESAANDNKKIMLYTKKWHNIENMLLFLENHCFNLNNDPNKLGWNFVFCISAYIKCDFFSLFPLYIFVFFILIFIYLFISFFIFIYLFIFCSVHFAFIIISLLLLFLICKFILVQFVLKIE